MKAFFASRRGQRVLRPPVQALLVEYASTRSLPLSEINVARPPEGVRFTRWLEEWQDFAAAAQVTDTLEARNVVRWIEEEDGSAASGSRTGKAFAVADALAKKGFAIDRAAELAISAALTTSDAGDAAAQCRCISSRIGDAHEGTPA